MADTGVEFGATPRGVAKLLRDDGSGTHSEVLSAQLWIWDLDTLTWRKMTEGDFASAGSAETSTIYNGSTAVTPKFKSIAVSSSGATELVALVSAKKIRVISYILVANAAVNVKFQSHTAGDITGLLYLAANGGVSSPYAPTGLFQTTAGEALDINLSGNVAVGGHISYIEVS